MPRTTDSIVACHMEASERRKQGRPVWDRTIKIKDLITGDDLDPPEISGKGKEVAKRIRAGVPKNWLEVGEDFDLNLDDIVNGFEMIAEEDDHKAGIIALEEFNGFLDQLYDWADRRRIWIG